MNWVDKLQELGVTPLEGDQFSPLSEDELERLENSVGVAFPDDYRTFLRQFGACDLEEYAVILTEDGSIAPGSFFGDDLAGALNDFSERLPRLVIPINDDGAGNLICISLRPDCFGAICFQSHSVGWDDSLGDEDAAKSATLIRVAPDFGSFICKLVLE
ncbi:SMI1/KNR4 family protein [Blastopirellula marina]|uniref:Knr4/Smi1-like domain-containing protein n=1 Tax=Blastopirellula marina DSM 3645 TaxID=314230 RepID=A3ZX25_9BACT|nr:SMI1/KNR4 family protein [Blastopirellula marina]EAQ78902.1 hypothetical protein DSM3645_27518 [Blastopirellula marina DSM 3645]